MEKRIDNKANAVVEGWKDAVCKDFKVSGEKKAGVYYAKKADKILRDLEMGVPHKRMRHG